MTTESDSQECYMCGGEATQKDHLPPESIFPKPYPVDRIWAPICVACHSGTSENDELFRIVVIAQQDLSSNRHAASVWATVKRGLKRPESRPSRAITELLGPVEFVTEAGIIIGQGGRARYDRKRVQSVINRIVRGMYWHRFGERLPDGYYVDDYIMDVDVDRLPDPILTPLKNSDPFETADKVYQYQMLADANEPACTVFFCRFFENTTFLTFTLPDPTPAREDPPDVDSAPTTEPGKDMP
jgi:hypothetical protein